MTLLHLATRGISVLRSMPRLVEVLHNLDEEADAENPERQEARRKFEKAKTDAEFAKQEVDKGFPLLHAQAVITLWGSLEDLIRVFIALLLEHEPETLKVEVLQRLKICVGDLLLLDEASRAEFLVEQLDRDLAGPLRQGTNRFESLLQPFGLSGDVERKVKDAPFELHHVRNLHAHRQGYADRRFCEACPWLEAEEGEYFQVTPDALNRYTEAISAYVLSLMYRIGLKYGWTIEEIEAHINRAAGEQLPGDRSAEAPDVVAPSDGQGTGGV